MIKIKPLEWQNVEGEQLAYIFKDDSGTEYGYLAYEAGPDFARLVGQSGDPYEFFNAFHVPANSVEDAKQICERHWTEFIMSNLISV